MALIQENGNKRVLSVFSLVMINVIAVDSLRTLPISAEYGFSLVFFYCLAAIIFFIPVALVSAELATGWPQRGGLYIWVREAFGPRAGFFTIWLQWIYNVVWYPTILAFIAATIAYLVNPLLSNDPKYLLFTVLAIFWGATFVNFFGMRVSSFISTMGAIFGTLIPMLIIIVLGIVWLSVGNPSAIEFSRQSFIPEWDNIGNLVLFTNVLFGLVGLEMSAVHAEEVKNPQRDYPKSLFYSVIIIFSTLTLSSLAVAVAVPQSELSLVSGLIDAFAKFFNAFDMPWMIPVIAGMIVLGGVSVVSTWVIGPTKGLMVAAADGNLPHSLAKMNRYGAPSRVLLLQAVVFTLLSSVYILMDTVNESYWLLSALTAQLALIVYVLMFAAMIKLRYSQPDKYRAYKIPGGNIWVWIIALLGTLTCVAAVILGFFPPNHIKINNIWFFEAFLWGGMILFCSVPFIHFHRQRKRN